LVLLVTVLGNLARSLELRVGIHFLLEEAEEEQEVGVAQEVLNEVQMGVDHLEVLPGVEGQEESHDMVLVLHEWDSQGVDGYHNQQLGEEGDHSEVEKEAGHHDVLEEAEADVVSPGEDGCMGILEQMAAGQAEDNHYQAEGAEDIHKLEADIQKVADPY